MTRRAYPLFPDFLDKRAAIRDEATTLWQRLSTENDPEKSQRYLEQLITNPEMNEVWKEIYRKKRGASREYFNPARLTFASQAAARREKAKELRKKGGEKNLQEAIYLDLEALQFDRLPEPPVSPDWSEQDCAAQHFLSRAYRIALDSKPRKFADLQKKASQLRGISTKLRALARELESLGEVLFPSYAEKLEDVADDCEDGAKVMTPNLINSPWLIVREGGEDPRLRTIVPMLADCTYHLFLKIMPTTIAHVTNVIYGCDHPDSQVKKMTRDSVLSLIGAKHDLTLRPTFGPTLYEKMQNMDRQYLRAFKSRTRKIT